MISHPLAKVTITEKALNQRCPGSESPDETRGAITERLLLRGSEKWTEVEFLLIYKH